MKIRLFLIFACVLVAVSASTIKPHHASHDENKHVKKQASSKRTSETALKGNVGSISHKIQDEEKALKKSMSKSAQNHQTHKKSAAQIEHAGKQLQSGKHKKAAGNKGYHEQYHKNEHKKHDSFFAHGKKSGDWKTFGAKNAKHSNHKIEKGERKNKMALKSLDKHGAKTVKKLSNHKQDEHKAHKVVKGQKNTLEKQSKWSKKYQKPEDKHKYKHSMMH